VSNCENRNKHNADRFYYQSSRIYIQKMENEKKKIFREKQNTITIDKQHLEKKKEKMIRHTTHTHTHIQTDKNSICDFIECGFFVA